MPIEEGEESTFSASLSLDYMFAEGYYLMLGGLYVSQGVTSFGEEAILSLQEVDAKQLMPGKYSSLIMLSKSLNPRSTISITAMYSPSMDIVLLNPSWSFSLAEDWDISLTTQSFWTANKEHLATSAYLRLRWSY